MATAATGNGAETVPDFENMNMTDSFCVLLTQLLDSLSTVFPECVNTKQALEKLKLVLETHPDAKDHMIESWHRNMSPHYSELQKKNIQVLKDLDFEILQMIELHKKMDDPDFDLESRDTLLQYINELNMLASMQNGVPKGVMKGMQGVMGDLMKEINGDPSKLGSVDIPGLTQKLFENISPDSLKELEAGLPQLMETMQSIMQNPEFSEAMSAMQGSFPGGMNPMDLIGKMAAGNNPRI
jgi:hypothetical protein